MKTGRLALNRNIDILSLNSTDKLFLYKVTVQQSLMLKLFPMRGHVVTDSLGIKRGRNQ